MFRSVRLLALLVTLAAAVPCFGPAPSWATRDVVPEPEIAFENKEMSNTGCGLGFEFVLAFGLLVKLRKRELRRALPTRSSRAPQKSAAQARPVQKAAGLHRVR